MTQPCPCRGCTDAYKAGMADQKAEWQSVLSSTNNRAANEALDRALAEVVKVAYSGDFALEDVYIHGEDIIAAIESARPIITNNKEQE